MKLDTSAAPELALLAAPPPGVEPAAFVAGATPPGPIAPGSAAPGTAAAGSGCPNPASHARPATTAGTTRPAEGNRPGGGADPADPAEGGRPRGGVNPAGLARPVTVGYLAACLRFLVEDPGRWWNLVRFDPRRPVRIPVTPPAPGCATWLLVLPPGNQDEPPGEAPRGGVSCLVAGAVTEQVSMPAGWQDRPLPCGRTRVHGSRGPSRLVNTGSGYAVTLHARPLPS